MITQESFWLGKYARIDDKSSPSRKHTGERGQIVGVNGTLVYLRYMDGGHDLAGMGVLVMDPDQSTPVWESKTPPPDLGPSPVFVVAPVSALEQGADGERLLDGDRFQGLSYSAAREAYGVRTAMPDCPKGLTIFMCYPTKDHGWWRVREVWVEGKP